MRSPEVSIASSVSVAPRPSIAAPTFSRPSFESFSPKPVASIVRHPGIFNPNISVSVNTPKIGSSRGESKPLSFGNTKPVEAPKTAPFADQKPNFGLKDTHILAKNPALSPLPEVKIHWTPKPKETIQNHISKLDLLPMVPHQKQETTIDTQKPAISQQEAQKETITERIARLEKLTMIPKMETPQPQETLAQRIERLEKIPFITKIQEARKPTENIQDSIARFEQSPMITVSEDLKTETIQERISRLEQIPFVSKQRQQLKVTPLITELKGNDRFNHLKQLLRIDSRVQRKSVSSEVQKIIASSQDIKPAVKNEVIANVMSETIQTPLLHTEAIAQQITAITEFIQTKQNNEIKLPQVVPSPLPLGEKAEEEDEETQALKANPEFQALLKKRSSLKSQGFTETQLDRLTHLQLQAKKMPAPAITKMMTLVQKEETEVFDRDEKVQQKRKFYIGGKDLKAMAAREKQVDAIADAIEKEVGIDARVDGSVFADNIDEAHNPKMRSHILEGLRKTDNSITEWKFNMRWLIHDVPVRMARTMIKQLGERSKAVKISDWAEDGASTTDLYRVVKQGDLVNVESLAETHRILYGQPIELINLRATNKQQVVTRRA